MKAKGKAATIDIVCNILSPFAEPTINDNANADCIIPHTNFLELGGFRSPLCDSIPNTNVAEFADRYHMFYRRVGTDRFYLFTDFTVLDQLMQDKFSVIDQFRLEAKNREIPLTLSMGFAYGDGDHDQIGKTALLNLNLAEVRGGDQAVVKENDEEISIFGSWLFCNTCVRG